MKKTCLLTIVLVVCVLFFFSFGNGIAEGKQLKFAYVMPWAQAWYAYLSDAFKYAAKKNNVKVEIAVTDYNQNAEISAIEDFIIKGPDMIALGSVSGDSAQLAAQKANKAGIPLIVENGSIAPGPGKIVSDLEFDWYGLGTMMADVTADNWPGAKVFVVTGVIGTGPIDMLLETLKKRAPERGIEIVGIQNGKYSHEEAYKITQDLIQSGKEFDVIWANNNTMGQGVIQAIKEAGLLGKKVLLTANGSPECIASLKKGELNGTINYSPGFHGLLLFLTMHEYMKTGIVPKLIELPNKYITKDNIADHSPWEAANEKQYQAAKAYLLTKLK